VKESCGRKCKQKVYYDVGIKDYHNGSFYRFYEGVIAICLEDLEVEGVYGEKEDERMEIVDDAPVFLYVIWDDGLLFEFYAQV